MPRAPSMHHYTSGQIKHTRTCKQKRYRQTHIQAILSAVDVTQRGCFHFSHLCQQLRHTHHIGLFEVSGEESKMVFHDWTIRKGPQWNTPVCLFFIIFIIDIYYKHIIAP